MGILVYRDTSFQQKTSGVCHLSIQSDLNGFFFAVYNFRLQKFIFFQHYSFEYPTDDAYYYHKNVEQAFGSSEVLNWSFRSVSYLHTSSHQTNVPTELFVPVRAIQILQLTSSYLDYEELRFDQVKFYKLTNIFAVPSFIFSLLSQKQPKTKFHHSTFSHLHILRDIALYETEKIVLLIDFQSLFYQISIGYRDLLVFCNHFTYKCYDDIVENIFTVLGYHKINKSVLYTCIIGDIESNKNSVNNLKKNIRILHFPQYIVRKYFASPLHKVESQALPHLFYAHKFD